MSKEKWGKMWARAIHHEQNDTFREDLEKSPRLAARKSQVPEDQPLFDPDDPDACDCMKKFYNRLEDLQKNQPKKVEDLEQGRNFKDKDIQRLLALLHGNQWTLRKNGADACTISHDIDGILGPDLPLTREQWGMVYAKAERDEKFQTQLKIDVTAAVDDFLSKHTNATFRHTRGAPILRLPKFLRLLGDPNLPLELQDPDELHATLKKIANGMGVMYDAQLCICLTC